MSTITTAKMTIPLSRPFVSKEEEGAVLEVLRSGWVSQGPRVTEFERRFADYVGAAQGVAVSSCTTALHLALLAAGIRPGDEVLCPSLSFIATANAIAYTGASPVFVDIDRSTYNIDPALIECSITPRTRGILVVHQIGLPSPLAEICDVASSHGLIVIEDAACAIGSEYKGRRIGLPHTSMACFSFHPRKILTTGEGGMITTGDDQLAARLRKLRQHAMTVSDLARHSSSQVVMESYDEVGYNYRMTDLQAAVGLVQLERLDEMLAWRRRLASRYSQGLSQFEWLIPPLESADCRHNFQSYMVQLKSDAPITRDRLMQELLNRGVSTRRGVMAIHREPPYCQEKWNSRLPQTNVVADTTIILPLFHAMTEEEVDYVIECLEQISQPLPQPPPIALEEQQSYGEILKSSALIGGSSILNIAIGIVRTKAMAVLLGPAGVGLLGLYGSIADLTQSLAGMGINSSGVRQIAEAVGSDDTERIARTTVVLRQTSILLGLLGALLLVVFSRQLSTLTFGSNQHAAAVALLSVAVFFRLVSAGQGALIQGMRRISNLAKMAALGALFGTLIAIPVVYVLREKGVVPSLVGFAAMTIITSWWYSRKVHIQTPSMTASQVGREAAALLKLGFAFMASGLMTMGVAYAVRIMILRKFGFEATGLYQSAWILGGLYLGFILQAMGADFYPRLTASIKDNVACNRLVNEQALVGLLLAGPGVIATLTFAPLVITLFYAAKFSAAVEILRWICLGATLQVITWPMGFIIVAKGRQDLFFGSELAWTIVAVALAWVCLRSFGLNGAGVAFFGSYIFHGFLIYPIVHRLSGFRWSTANRGTGLFFLSLIGIVFCGFYLLPVPLATGVGTLAVVLSGAYSIRVLRKLLSLEDIPRPMRRLISRFGFVPSASTAT